MSWQDELRRLDAELANGTITQHQHRKMRDELLAAASGNVAPASVSSSRPAEAAPQWQSANPAHAGAGQVTWPEAQPQTEPPQDPQPDHGQRQSALASEEAPTQSISAQLLSTHRTTSAPSPADERATDSMRFPSIEDAPTIVTHPVAPPGRPLPTMGPPPMHAGQLPPQHLPFDPAPRLQAPPKRKPTWLFVTFGIIVVVALVAAGVWFLRDPGGSTTAAPSPSAAGSPEAVDARLPTLPGTPSPNNGTLTIDQGIDLKLYSREEGQLMKTNGATQVIFRGSSQGPQGYLVLAVPTGSPTSAAAITRGLYEHALTAGLQTIPSGSTDAKAVTGNNSAGQMSGTWYTSGNYAVAIWVSQGLEGDPAAMSARLAQTRTSLATALPPS